MKFAIIIIVVKILNLLFEYFIKHFDFFKKVIKNNDFVNTSPI